MSWNKMVNSGNFKRKVKKNIEKIKNEKIEGQYRQKDVDFAKADVETMAVLDEATDLIDCSNSSNCLSNENFHLSDKSLSSVSSEDTSNFNRLKFYENQDQKLKKWVLQHNITHIALKDLLDILNEDPYRNLPKDPRTFLSTPAKITINEITGGKYWHHGLQKCIEDIYYDTRTNHDISININIDGLPIYKSSKNEFWPILFNINEIQVKPMIIGIYYGKGKPGDLNEFLSPLVEELLNLLHEGMKIGENKINVTLKCFICDSPARSFVKGVANFNSQHGCQKCTSIGEYSHLTHMNYYPNKEYPIRTDENFREKKDECHHKTDSELLKLPIDMISCFPVADSLHLIDLGVMKRLLTGWKDGYYKNKALKWPAATTDKVTEQLLQVKLPQELHRAVRGLDCINHWKGLEYKHFLLYYGIVILKNILRPDVYEHFLCLFCAITICSTEFYNMYLHIAEKMLIHFVDIYSKIYGEHYITSNIHNLVHLVEDVKTYGNLNKFNAYPFESKLYEIKNMLRTGSNALAQVARRLVEKHRFQNNSHKESLSNFSKISLKYMTKNTFLRNIIDDKNAIIYEKIIMKEFCLGRKSHNNWFMTKNNDIVYFIAVAKSCKRFLICGKKIKEPQSFFYTPINSNVLNVYRVQEELMTEESIFELTDIKCKLIRVVTNNNIVFIPLLHTLS